MKVNFLRVSFALLCLFPNISSASNPFPTKDLRLKIFNGFVAEIERLDGEGLIPRANRPESWKATMARLRLEAAQAETPFEFGRVLKRVDATYPNLHAHITLDPDYDYHEKFGRVRPAVNFIPEVVGGNAKQISFRVSGVNKILAPLIPERIRPQMGDEVLKVNGRSMAWWRKENFLFCKQPQIEQCDDEIWDNFRKEFLSWDREEPLIYQLRRGKKIWQVKIPVVPERAIQQSKSDSKKSPMPCDVDEKRYPDFKLVYEGYNACIFESEKYPQVSVWRIKSFRYRDLPKGAQIDALEREVDLVWEKYWKKKAPETKKVVLDIIDNGGGDTPIAWYKLFLREPFQEEYTQFKKIVELENAEIRKEVFYDDPAKEIWFQNILKDGTYSKTAYGDFLPAVPQFCADETKDCREGLFKPLEHGFKGDVHILVNPYCVSSCVGFAWELKTHLKNRVQFFGSPDSGDSAYARVYLDAILDGDEKKEIKFKVAPRAGRTAQELPDGVLFRQQVSVTRSTDKAGNVISGVPQTLDKVVPSRFDQDYTDWISEVFKEALK